MDIKDFILIGGGLLIAAVVAHGFWIAWRGRQEPLRIDIRPDLIPDHVDDIERLRGELPNGGARVIHGGRDTRQQTMEFEVPEPLELAPSEGPPPAPRAEGVVAGREEPQLSAESARPEAPPAQGTELRTEARHGTERAASPRARVAEVALPDSLRPATRRRDATGRGGEGGDAEERMSAGKRKPAGNRAPAGKRVGAEKREPAAAEPAAAPAEELIIINVLASPGHAYTGDGIFAVLRGKGLKFGDMNIFHRVEPLTKALDYSVANVVEPGTFDMADMEAFRAPGLCFFMQLPGPEHPTDAFDDMLDVAREVATRLGGELSDEQRNRLTPQTEAHYRQRIADFSRRRMSKRA